MRKIILCVAVSLDGYIEGPKGEYDWCYTDQDYGMTPFLERIDTIFYGRKSYDVAGGNVFPGKRAYIFSNTLKKSPDDAILVSGDVLQQVREMKQQKGKDIWLFGGAVLITALMNADLVDELFLAVHPLVLGAGKPLFQHIEERKPFKLLGAQTYSSGLVSLTYQREA